MMVAKDTAMSSQVCSLSVSFGLSKYNWQKALKFVSLSLAASGLANDLKGLPRSTMTTMEGMTKLITPPTSNVLRLLAKKFFIITSPGVSTGLLSEGLNHSDPTTL